MDEQLFNVGLEARTRVLGEEYVTRAFATADSFNIEFQQLVTEYCWGAVWGRSGLDDRQRSLNNFRARRTETNSLCTWNERADQFGSFIFDFTLPGI